jgi:hypothetical protein
VTVAVLGATDVAVAVGGMVVQDALAVPVPACPLVSWTAPAFTVST